MVSASAQLYDSREAIASRERTTRNPVMTDTTLAPIATKQTGIVLGRDHAGIGKAAEIPVTPATPIVAISPVTLSGSIDRIVDLELKVTAPTTGENLPIILYSHGGGLANYLTSYLSAGPLVDFWASHGFVVIQPTHLTSKSLQLGPSTPGFPLFWESRISDMKQILDQLDLVENAVPEIKGRLDRSRIAVAGHSFGGQTASMLLGADFVDDDGTKIYTPDARVKAGILMATTGAAGDHLTEASTRFAPFRTAGFSEMTTPTLVVIGDKDFTWELSSKGAEYHADPYTFAPGPKSLLTLVGGEHLLGGTTGYDAAGTTDENPERVAVIQRLTLAYLQSTLNEGDPSWDQASATFAGLPDLGSLENK
jgi:acetyl esterase/lipase